MPSFLLATTFLDRPCGVGATHGVNPELRERLQAADAAIRTTFAALAPERRIDPLSGEHDASFAAWCGIAAPHRCWRANAGRHSSGSAIDLGAAESPFIAIGRGSGALEAYDRAMRFAGEPGATADVSPRRPNESTPEVWSRFKAVSDALGRYLRFAIDPEAVRVTRVPIEDPDALGDEELLAAIPEGERLNLDRAVAALEAYPAGVQAGAAREPAASRARYLRMLRDYEVVRIPMAIGESSTVPVMTHNPARGFLDVRSEVVSALCDQGLRWGACDLDGSAECAVMTHFDLVDDGGYPEVHSLLRFG